MFTDPLRWDDCQLYCVVFEIHLCLRIPVVGHPDTAVEEKKIEINKRVYFTTSS